MKLIQKQQEEEIMNGKAKEVDEWLMGSGESAETAASKQERNNQIGSGLIKGNGQNGQHQERTQTTEIETQLTVVEHTKQTNQEDENDDTTWMFRTFSKTQTPNQQSQNHNHIKISVPDETYQQSS